MFLCIYFKDKSQGPSDAAAGPTQTSISRSGILNHFTDLQWGASVKDAGPPPPHRTCPYRAFSEPIQQGWRLTQGV